MKIKELKENSIKIDGPITVCRPQYSHKECVLNVMYNVYKFNNRYAVNNSVICFIDNHEMFVTPYTEEAIEALESVGLSNDRFYVPFSNWDYPKYEQRKWKRLCERAYGHPII